MNRPALNQNETDQFPTPSPGRDWKLATRDDVLGIFTHVFGYHRDRVSRGLALDFADHAPEGPVTVRQIRDYLTCHRHDVLGAFPNIASWERALGDKVNRDTITRSPY